MTGSEPIKHFGRFGEILLLGLLLLKNLRVVERRFHSRAGEIDLIFRHGELMVWGEVKAWRDGGSAADAMPPGTFQETGRISLNMGSASISCWRFLVRSQAHRRCLVGLVLGGFVKRRQNSQNTASIDLG